MARFELTVTALVKRYPGVRALDGVSLRVESGEALAVVGENGAGKSTLMRLIAGAEQPDAGSIAIDGILRKVGSPREAHRLGIRMIHQELTLVPELSVAENVFLGAEPTRYGIVERQEQLRSTRAVLDRVGQTELDPGAKVGRLPLPARQMTEIAKSVAQRARLLILDEPTGILARPETEALFAVIDQLKRDGVAIIYISHRLDEVHRVADRIAVLRDGRNVVTKEVADLGIPELVRHMVGRELGSGYPERRRPAGNEILRLETVSAGPVRKASLSLHRGEIAALVGLGGSGRSELARTIFGAIPIRSGEMRLDGIPYHPSSPKDAIARGVGLLPEDRKGQGLILQAAVRVNASLATLPSLARAGVVDRRREHGEVTSWARALGVQTPSLERPVRELSGGNQQKVVLVRWMLARSRVLLFDEPTRGIDVGARAEIYRLIRQLADQGVAILLISSDLEEALGMADRLLVMRQGRLVGDLPPSSATRDALGTLMLAPAEPDHAVPA